MIAPLDPRRVTAVHNPAAVYPEHPPFHPGEQYPEAPFPDISPDGNAAYALVREAFARAGLDEARRGTPGWNPLGDLIHPGETVLLKPNLVKEMHPRDPDGWKYVLTHGSIVRAVADYVFKALDGRGRVVLADAPQTDSSFAAIVERLGLDRIRDFYVERGLPFELVDLRQEEWTTREGVVVHRRKLPGDPRGAVAFDLGEASEFAGHAGAGSYYGADHDVRVVNVHHSGGRHEYLLARSAVECDVVFSLPKLKTHKKAGLTASLKNLVGINADKNWLPHYTEGRPADGGDEHPAPGWKHRIERRFVAIFRAASGRVPLLGPWVHRQAKLVGTRVFGDTDVVLRSGNWWGNDTIWRMCLDLNKLVFYGDGNGTLRHEGPRQRKRHIALVDGILAGEGRGPMDPDPLPAGTLLFGTHPASVDAACCWLMGFDPEKVPIVRQAFRCTSHPLAEWEWRDIVLASNRPDWTGALPEIGDEATFHFRPHFGWQGRIERRPVGAPVA